MNPQIKKTLTWQNIVIIFVLLFMLISALPNLYTDHVIINLTPKNALKTNTSLQAINQTLTKHNLVIDEINSSDSNISISLRSKSDQYEAVRLMTEKYADQYAVSTSVVNSAPHWLKVFQGKPIKLGLDLSGGVLFVLDVDTEQALSDTLKSIALDIKSQAIKKRIRITNVEQPSPYTLRFSFISSISKANQSLLSDIAKSYPELTKSQGGRKDITFTYSSQAQVKFRQETMKQTLKIMRGRIAELGITEAVTQRQGKNRIRIELPGVHNPEEAKRIIGATASLDFYQLAEHSLASSVIYMKDDQGRRLALNSKVVFSGSNIKNAHAGHDEMGGPLVNLTLDSIGGKKMSAFSKKNIGNPMVTVFSEYYRDSKTNLVKNSKVINVATIQQHLGPQFSITNMPSISAAQELALLLRAGSLTAPVTIVKERNIEATLGVENIDNGIKALSIGVSITLLFMALWYRMLGAIANIALALNLVSLLGLMSLLPGAVLTLPGIAGLVLTIGMAVDTNVLIFERIKEGLKRGQKTLFAIENGYKSAFSTILDANITTMITGIILYTIGYGPVKGFAITLCLGILTSMFTGIFVSKALTNLVIRQNKAQLLGVNI